MGTEALIGEAGVDCLTRRLELNGPGQRLVNRVCARPLGCFHLPPISSQSVVHFQRHCSGYAQEELSRNFALHGGVGHLFYSKLLAG